MHDGTDFDDSLAARIRDGDDAALTELMDRTKRPILNFVYRLLGNASEADDVAQEVFVRVYQNIRQFRPGRARFSTWLFQIARNAAIDHLRKRARRREELLDETTPAAASREVEANEIGGRIAIAVAELPEDQRTAFVLAEYHGKSYAEIAEVMSCSEKSVESRLYRAKQFLKEKLADLIE
jgi:RNA polymerase sigma-70 factor (ECF subfamily)